MSNFNSRLQEAMAVVAENRKKNHAQARTITEAILETLVSDIEAKAKDGAICLSSQYEVTDMQIYTLQNLLELKSADEAANALMDTLKNLLEGSGTITAERRVTGLLITLIP